MPRPGRLLDSPLGRFGPPVALMSVIFLLSAQPDLNSGLGVFDLIGRKLVHATEYGVLWFLWLRALRFRHPWVAALICHEASFGLQVHVYLALSMRRLFRRLTRSRLFCC